jgi:arylformamidase
MHIELFPYGIIHAESLGGEIDLLLNRRVDVGFFPWRFVDGESCIGRCVAILDDKDYEKVMAEKEKLPKTKFGDAYNPAHVTQIEGFSKANKG